MLMPSQVHELDKIKERKCTCKVDENKANIKQREIERRNIYLLFFGYNNIVYSARSRQVANWKSGIKSYVYLHGVVH